MKSTNSHVVIVIDTTKQTYSDGYVVKAHVTSTAEEANNYANNTAQMNRNVDHVVCIAKITEVIRRDPAVIKELV